MRKMMRLLYTLSFMKSVQVLFQLWYRVKNKYLQLNWYDKYLPNPLHEVSSKLYPALLPVNNAYTGGIRFTFLNLSHEFTEYVDWSFSGYGKLWNYNLQYFDFLLNESVPLNQRLELLHDFSVSLLKGDVKPEPYPVSLRVINTLLFISKNKITDDGINLAVKKQIYYLECNSEKHLLANHLLENAYTLYISAFALQHEGLFRKANRLLQQQLKEQVLPDGAHYECTPMYHSILLSKLLLCIDIAKNNQGTLQPDILPLEQVASRMAGWIKAFSFPDGSWAMVNDSAPGIAPSTEQLLEAATQADLAITDVKMKSSGYRKLMSDNWEALIDVGNIIPPYQPGHAHADMLNFCLWYKGKQVIIDPAISTYNVNERRSAERSTANHNTVSIHHQNQSDVWGAFRVGKRAHLRIIEDGEKCIKALHDGYQKKYGAIHTRTFACVANGLVIHDEINPAGNHEAEAALFFDIDSEPHLSAETLLTNEGICIKISHAKSITLERYQQNIGFNKSTTSICCKIAFSERLQILFFFQHEDIIYNR